MRALRIDSLKLDRLDLLKIDVEGMEIDVLRGAVEAIRRYKPILMVEHQKTDTAAMRRMIQDHGYRIYDTDGMNLLAVHADDKSGEHIVGPNT